MVGCMNLKHWKLQCIPTLRKIYRIGPDGKADFLARLSQAQHDEPDFVPILLV
jgi:hypothetical protein